MQNGFDKTQTVIFWLVCASSVALALYSLRYLFMGWSVDIGGHVLVGGSEIIARDLAQVSWSQQAMRLMVVCGDLAVPFLLWRRSRALFWLLPVLLILAQSGWFLAAFSGENYALHAAVTNNAGFDWMEFLDWMKLLTRLLALAGSVYLLLTPRIGTR